MGYGNYFCSHRRYFGPYMVNGIRIKRNRVDKLFLLSVLILLIVGFFIFTSASLGLLAKEKGNFGEVTFNQTFFGLFLGSISLIILSRVHYRQWRKYALYIFLFSVILTILVWVPFLGFEHNGAKRWISLGPVSLQPAEFLKIGFVIYLAAWLSGVGKNIGKIEWGLAPLLILLAIIAAVLVVQPDIGTFVVISSAGFAMFVAAKAKWRDILIVILIGMIGFALIAMYKPYIRQRIFTFLDPSVDQQRTSYQLKQSLIAIGRGGFGGQGFGQSIQKFDFLPEPVGDSIFAVAAEEFGFVGSVLLILFFLFFTFQGFKIANRSPDLFGGLLTLGIVILILSQSFFNISAMLGVLPLSGMPLLFVSHGGTALFFTLSSVGIILNISRYQSR